MRNHLFLPAPFFILRAPTYPADHFQSHLHSPNWVEEIIENVFKDEKFRESILVTSPSLYDGIKRTPLKEPEKIANSLLYYATRMTNRATPFGLFSFVATGSWSDQTAISFTDALLTKRYRPDMEWIWALIKKYYAQNLLQSDLKVQTNVLLQLEGDRITLRYVRYGEKNELKKESISIRANELFLTVLSCAKTPLTLQELVKLVKHTLPNLDENKIASVLLELFETQFLLPDVLPSLLNLNLYNLPFEESKEILKDISQIETLPTGKGEHALLHVQEKMKNIAEASSYLQVDLAYKDAPFSLSHRVHEEASEPVELIWKLSTKLTQKDPLSPYHKLFIERYGIHRTVPLLELLNEVKGLGSVENNPLIDDKETSSAFDRVWDKWLHQTIQESLNKRETEISLPPDLFEQLSILAQTSPIDYRMISPSFDLFCKILAPSQQSIDQGNFELYFSFLAPQGGSSLGRFLDILGEKITKSLSTFLENEEMTEPNNRYVELSFWPNQARVGNVAIQPCLRKYVLDTEGKEKDDESVITLDDIYIGATFDRLYATDKNGEYEIVAKTGNLLTAERAPEPLRFLKLLTNQKYKPFHSPFDRKELANLIFIPRVRYKKTILSPATWNLDGSFLTKHSKGEILKHFLKWAEEWNLPQYSFFVQTDNHLLINKDHPACQKKIINHLKNGEKIQLIENLSSNWVQGEHGNHVSEVVIPFVKNHHLLKNLSPIYTQPFYPTAFDQRWRLPGSNWIYFKFYLKKEGEEKFLINHLFKFLKKEDVSWFFVRYTDPAPHLRVRILKNENSSLLTHLEKISKFWMEMGLIKNIVMTSYEREIERYGGKELIEIAEKIFCRDSLTVVHLLQFIDQRKFNLDPSIIYPLSVIHFLKGFQLNNHQIIALLGKRIKDKIGLKGYREHKSLLHSLILECKETSSASNEHLLFKHPHELSLQAKNEFISHAHLLSENQLFDIIDSLLHMHCNRLTGSNKDEQQARQFALKALIEIESRIPGLTPQPFEV